THLVKDMWERYAVPSPTADHRLWMREVKRRHKVEITPQKLGWWRWKLEVAMKGDETMMAQEFGSLPEECWQSIGQKFLTPTRIREMRLALRTAPKPEGYDYVMGRYLEDTSLVSADPETASLKVWERPQPDGVYVVAGHPAGSSSPEAMEYVAQ